MKTEKYYHAGAELKTGVVEWSSHTRYTIASAMVEAEAMARRLGGKPVVEEWDADHGRRPADASVTRPVTP